MRTKNSSSTHARHSHWLIRLIRLVLGERIDWKEHQLITMGGIVYTIREANGHEREIKNARTGVWAKESETTFSSVPHWENYHREEYRNAIPFENNKVEHASRPTTNKTCG